MAPAKISAALALSWSIITTSGTCQVPSLVGRVGEVFLHAAAAGGDDDAAFDEPVGHFDRADQQPAGIAAEVDHQALHPLAVQFPEGRVQVAGGGLLEAGELEVADAPLRIDDAHLIDAGHFDAAAADGRLAAAAAPRVTTLELHDAALFALQQVGGRSVAGRSHRLAVDRDDPVAGPQPASSAGLPGITRTISRPPSCGFSSTPRPTKLPSICE